jgi:hypothetical protein
MGVLQFTGDVVKLLYDYIQAASQAMDDIETMVKTLVDLEKLLRSTNELLKAPHGDRYGTAQEFKKELASYKSCLAELHSKLEIKSGKGKRKRDRLGNALKWPFQRKSSPELFRSSKTFKRGCRRLSASAKCKWHWHQFMKHTICALERNCFIPFLTTSRFSYYWFSSTFMMILVGAEYH